MAIQERTREVETRNARLAAAITALTPVVLMAALVYHPYIPNPMDKTVGAAALAADTTRWLVSHLLTALASGLIILAFLAVRSYLREAGENRWSLLALPFIVMGSVLYALLPAMEIGVLAAHEAGVDALAVHITLDRWFFPILLSGSATFAIGAIAFAWAISRSGILSPGATWLVVGGLIALAALRFVPLGAAFYLSSAAGIAALWPLAYVMWRRPEGRAVQQQRPLPAH